MAVARAAGIADAAVIAAIEVETWRTTYAGILPPAMLIGMDERRRTGAWRRTLAGDPGDTIVGVEEGQVIGFGSCGRQRAADLPYTGEVFTLYISPDYQGLGSGRLLLRALFERLVKCGHQSSLLWVLQGNPSRFFYERLGGRFVASRRIEVWRGERVDAAAYGWSDLPSVLSRSGQSQSRID